MLMMCFSHDLTRSSTSKGDFGGDSSGMAYIHIHTQDRSLGRSKLLGGVKSGDSSSSLRLMETWGIDRGNETASDLPASWRPVPCKPASLNRPRTLYVCSQFASHFCRSCDMYCNNWTQLDSSFLILPQKCFPGSSYSYLIDQLSPYNTFPLECFVNEKNVLLLFSDLIYITSFYHPSVCVVNLYCSPYPTHFLALSTLLLSLAINKFYHNITSDFSVWYCCLKRI